MNRKQLAQLLQQKDCTTEPMQQAIDEWFAMYFQQEVTQQEEPCQRLPTLIVHKLSRSCFGEYQAKSHQPFGDMLLKQIARVKRKAIQLTLIGGEAWIKPILREDGFDFEVMRRDSVLVLARDANGQAIDIASGCEFFKEETRYAFIERRIQTPQGVRIENRLFQYLEKREKAVEISLNQIEEYAALSPEVLLPKIEGLGLIWLHNPMENCVDGSGDSVSIYAPAVGLIRAINQNERQLSREFEHGESRVFASVDLLRRNGFGHLELPKGLFVGLDDDPQTTGITIYSPTLRQESFLQRKKEYLRNLESLIGLKRGLLSEVDSLQRTAAEITGSSGEYSLTIREIQQIWEDGLEQAIKLCTKLADLYKIPKAVQLSFEKDISICWGDGIFSTSESRWQELVQMVQLGLMKPEVALGERFGLPYDTKEQRKKIFERYIQKEQEDQQIERTADSTTTTTD